MVDEIYCSLLCKIMSNEMPNAKDAKDAESKDTVYGLNITIPEELEEDIEDDEQDDDDGDVSLDDIADGAEVVHSVDAAVALHDARLVVIGVLVSFGFGSAAAVAAAGLMLAQIRQIVDIRDAGHAPCDHGRELLDARLRDIEQQIAQLSALRDTIAGLRDDAAQPEPETCSAGQVCRYV